VSDSVPNKENPFIISGNSLIKDYKDNKVSVEEYVTIYTEEVLDKLDPSYTYQTLLNMVREDNILIYKPALCCYESYNDDAATNPFCHRHLVSQWFNNAGIKCKELSKN